MVAQVKSSQIGFNRKWCNSGEWLELTKPCKLRFPDGIRSCAKPRWVKDGDVSHCFHTSHDFQSTIRFLSVDQYRNENFFETRTFNWVPSFSFSFTSIRQKSDKSFTWYLAGVRLMSIEDRISSIRSDTWICQRTRSNWSTDNSDKSFRCCLIVRNLSLFNLFMFLKISICICISSVSVSGWCLVLCLNWRQGVSQPSSLINTSPRLNKTFPGKDRSSFILAGSKLKNLKQSKLITTERFSQIVLKTKDNFFSSILRLFHQHTIAGLNTIVLLFCSNICSSVHIAGKYICICRSDIVNLCKFLYLYLKKWDFIFVFEGVRWCGNRRASHFLHLTWGLIYRWIKLVIVIIFIIMIVVIIIFMSFLSVLLVESSLPPESTSWWLSPFFRLILIWTQNVKIDGSM